MMRTYVLLGVLLVCLVGASGAVVAAESTGAVCAEVSDEETVVVGATPAGSIGADDTITLYPESQLRVLVCEGGEVLDRDGGETWNMTGQDGIYAVEALDERSVRVTVKDPDGFDLERHVENLDSDDQFTVDSPSELVYESELLDSDIRLSDASSYEELGSHEESFRNTSEHIDELIESLNETRQTLSADDHDAIDEHKTTLETLRSEQGNVHNETASFKQLLYEQALNHPRTGNATEAMKMLDTEQTERDNETALAASASVERLEEIESDLQSTIRRNVGIGMAGGLLAGILVGVIGPWRKGKEVDDFYQVSSKNKYTADVLKLPVLAGLALLVGGIVGMGWFGILGVLV